jgi:uncharacterized protein
MAVMEPQATFPRLPWWRVRMVWLVIAGPALVVAAGVATTVAAVRGADRPVAEAASRAVVAAPAQAPALQGRNHAATAR